MDRMNNVQTISTMVFPEGLTEKEGMNLHFRVFVRGLKMYLWGRSGVDRKLIGIPKGDLVEGTENAITLASLGLFLAR